MIDIKFTEEEIQALCYQHHHHSHPRVRRRMEVLLLKSQKFPHKKICRITGICPNTLCNYLRAYQQGGIEKLKELNFYKPTSELDQHRDLIEVYFRRYPPASIKEAMAKIEELTGLKRTENCVREYLISIGMRCRKVGMVPAKADPQKQEEFKKKELDHRLEEAKAGKRAVYFVDAAHFVLAPFLGMLWSFTRLFVQASAGRMRFNVLGAINAITHELITVTNTTYINAESVCELLRSIARLNLEIPITLVLDNAKYQKCKLVYELANALNIELLFLPPYSPNLNLIERLWKFVKKKCLYSKYYSNFTDFKAAITDCLSQTHTTYKKELDSLLTLKFQTFKESQIVNL